jgi:hypothetical protein
MIKKGKLLERYNERIGLKIKYWTLIEYKFSKNKRPIYLCRCECGKEKLVKYCGGIKQLDSASCGCKSGLTKYKRLKGPVELLKKYSSRYSGYKTEAKKRNYSFELTYEQFCTFMDKNCFYCNSPPSNRCKYNYLEIVHSGIDRVDNTKGYSLDNCVSCCKNCNSIKKSIAPDMVKKIYEFIFGNKDVR